MKEKFSQDYPRFKTKIANFVLTQNFTDRCKEYEEYFEQMSSISPDDMKEYVQKSPTFLKARNKSLSMMENIVDIHRKLKELFELNEDELGLKYSYNLLEVDKEIAKLLQEAAFLLKEFEKVSQIGRDAIKKADDPFLSQVHQ